MLAAEQRLAAELAKESAASAAVARAQLEHVKQVVVTGCQQAECNGSFTPRPAHDGWPRFENEHGMHLYYFTAGRQWFINDRFAPEALATEVHVRATDGSLPVGQGNWAFCQPSEKTQWADMASITVALQ